ncbi:MAG: hypothetical protein JWO30_4142 [Fibrobacteres bacterium]|nr:hypothetical protein [Fibrobacterota bacterium]
MLKMNRLGTVRRKGWSELSRVVALGTVLLAATVWMGCQNSGIANPPGNGTGAQAIGVKQVLRSDSAKGAHGEWLWEKATCKDKGPADFGIAFKCTNDADPVCSCDGKTYTNYCQAWGISGMNVDHKGACAGDPIVDSGPAGNPGSLTCGDPVPNVAVKCTNESHPVCGCDGVTYVNGCQALGIGHVNVSHEGACTGLIK